MTGLTLTPGVGEIVGPLWFVGNIISIGVNNKTIIANIQEAVEKKYGPEATHY